MTAALWFTIGAIIGFAAAVAGAVWLMVALADADWATDLNDD
jgi:hypothetical protein